jgi:hypothetical protein
MQNQDYSLLTLNDYKAYFKSIVDRATFLDNFFYTYSELTDGAKKNRGGTIFVLEPYSNQISGAIHDNVLGERQGMFVIAKANNSILEMSDIHAECEKYASKVIGQMQRDHRKHLLRAEISNWSGHFTGRLTAANYTGYAIEFTFHAPINRFMVAEEGDWI